MKVAVAIALGLGTMVGWKRIVITVGEKIGKSHLTYAQGSSAEAVAAATIAAADYSVSRCRRRKSFRPVSPAPWRRRLRTQMTTVRNMLMAWVLTLPMAIMLSGGLYVLFVSLF